MTAPEWIESRRPLGQKDDGSWNYSDWSRIYPKSQASTFASGGEVSDGIFVTGLLFGGTQISFLDSKYNNKTFNEVVNSILPGAGFCATEWKNSKTECDGFPDYCYTKDEVIQSLLLKRRLSLALIQVSLEG